MTTLFAVLIIFAAGFFVGYQVGYKNVMTDIQHVIDKVERANRRQ